MFCTVSSIKALLNNDANIVIFEKHLCTYQTSSESCQCSRTLVSISPKPHFALSDFRLELVPTLFLSEIFLSRWQRKQWPDKGVKTRTVRATVWHAKAKICRTLQTIACLLAGHSYKRSTFTWFWSKVSSIRHWTTGTIRKMPTTAPGHAKFRHYEKHIRKLFEHFGMFITMEWRLPKW